MFTNTRFAELLQGIPKRLFATEVEKSKADRYAKSIKSWDVLVTMIYGQIRQVSSLRTLVTGFSAQKGVHYHLNSREIRRSTLSDALRKRSPEPFRVICEALAQQVGRQQRKRINQMITLLDSTCITLRGAGYDEWTLAHKTRITQGLKLHVAMDATEKGLLFSRITPANVNDLTAAQELPIEPKVTYVFDKGYCDYNWWHDINEQGAYFVTRLKKNANITVIEERRVCKADSPVVLSEQMIMFGKKHLSGKRINQYLNKPIRRIVVKREDKETPLILVTNDIDRSAGEIADLYKQRWQIELLFKWMKQKLKLKKYFGYSENAVRIQIYCAVIAYLLMLLLNNRTQIAKSLSEAAIILAHGLFQRAETDRVLYHRRRDKERALAALQVSLLPC